MLFSLKKGAGDHFDGENKYKAGDVVESSKDLVALFDGKFDRLDKPVDEVNSEQVNPDIPAPITKGAPKKQSPVASPDKSDVSHLFPTAGKVGLTVKKNGKGFNVVDPATGAKLNPKVLPNEIKVEEFLKHYLAG